MKTIVIDYNNIVFEVKYYYSFDKGDYDTPPYEEFCIEEIIINDVDMFDMLNDETIKAIDDIVYKKITDK